jgi:hypothetical protein
MSNPEYRAMTFKTMKDIIIDLKKENAELREQINNILEFSAIKTNALEHEIKKRTTKIEKAHTNVIRLRQDITFMKLETKLFKRLDNRLITHQEILEGRIEGTAGSSKEAKPEGS